MWQSLKDYWFYILYLILASVIGVIFKKMRNYKSKLDSTQLGVRALLRSEMIGVYNKYNELEYFPIYERESVADMLSQYEILNGNGIIKSLIEKLYELPTEKPIV